ncbi:type I secretion system permease/ATPase [Coralloluteibacterium stylophorae]|uniref:Type I secretion system permease/ATPase n=1 Tax=Coralloluteibacterium stylophorae TaxID=1776034 RepID=A0A8J8AXC7_9GAMM|nr:type I secretion system permease/ATPase [Coralloluteibacterium stylophorae]MBS7457398.1 type I secretion system permease/ATPase [Coralloluteibacterium stylophorae]
MNLMHAVPAEDPLREGLCLLAARLGRPASPDLLADGVALEQGRLPLSMVPRVMRRAGLVARVVRQRAADVPEDLLPALVLRADGRSLLLLSRRGGDCVVARPELGGGEEVMDAAALDAAGSGEVVLARVAAADDGRAGDYAEARRGHWFYRTLRPLWPIYVEVGVAALVANLLAVASALFAMQVYDRVVPNFAFDTLWILASGVVLAVGMEALLRVLRAHLLDAAGRSLDVKLSQRLFEQVLRMRLDARPGSPGAFSAQVREFEAVREFFTSSTAAAVSDLPFVLLFIAIIAVISGPVALVPAAAVVLILAPGLLLQRYLAAMSRRNLREGAVRNGVLLEAIEHLETVKAAQAEGRSLRQWEMLSERLSSAGVQSRSVFSMLASAAAGTQQLTYAAIVVVGVYQIAAGELTVGGLIACSILGSRATAPMAGVAGLLSRWQHTKVALEGLDGLMAAPVERPEGRRFTRLPQVEGRYEVRELRVQHAPDAPRVLEIDTLDIAPGERVALLGGNGAGKSTLLRLLSGFAAPTEGGIRLDGVALEQLDPADRRRAIGYLPQDVALFHGSLRENLLLDRHALEDAELLEVLDAVGLGAFVRSHPQGLDLAIAGNRSLSGGQRQAVGLARLILQDPRVVLMDEPTAAFDQASEQKVVAFLQRWLGGRTLVLATHKRALLAVTGRVVVLRNGRVVGDGAPGALVRGNRVAADAVAEANHGDG